MRRDQDQKDVAGALSRLAPKSKVSADLHRASVRERQLREMRGEIPLVEPAAGGRYLLGAMLLIVAIAIGLIALIAWLVG